MTVPHPLSSCLEYIWQSCIPEIKTETNSGASDAEDSSSTMYRNTVLFFIVKWDLTCMWWCGSSILAYRGKSWSYPHLGHHISAPASHWGCQNPGFPFLSDQRSFAFLWSFPPWVTQTGSTSPDLCGLRLWGSGRRTSWDSPADTHDVFILCFILFSPAGNCVRINAL